MKTEIEISLAEIDPFELTQLDCSILAGKLADRIVNSDLSDDWEFIESFFESEEYSTFSLEDAFWNHYVMSLSNERRKELLNSKFCPRCGSLAKTNELWDAAESEEFPTTHCACPDEN